MKSHKDHQAGNLPARRWLAALVIAVAAAGAGASVAGGAPALHHPRHAGPMNIDPVAMDAHIDKMVSRLAGDATPEQRARVAAIAKKAMADLRAGHAKNHKMHARAHELLMAPMVDRAALEQLRLVHVRQVDAGSRRIVEAVADAADVLTPEQRAGFAGHLKHLMP